ncbi:MAG: tryptophan-rich sensory protein [Clostridia bacterium]|nr:tryptophan-rich sensory protein [Clostridia bacterium]
MKSKIKTYAVSIAAALAVGGLSALLTGDGMEKYKLLRQPSLAPSGWIFPIVWTVLYVLMGIGAAMVCLSGSSSKKKPLIIYGMQLLVNFFWTILFFMLEARLFAFIWLLLLLVLAIWMAVSFGRVHRTAGLLQIPYILWLMFAGYLNFAVYLLNG